MFLRELKEMEEVKRVPYITSIEEFAKKEGMLENAQESVIDAIETRFDEVPEDMAKQIREMKDLNILKNLLKKAIKSETLDEFRTVLKKIKDK